jgi:hypothetical protein
MKRLVLLLFIASTACTTGSNTVELNNIFGLDGYELKLGCNSPCTDPTEIGFSAPFKFPFNDLDTEAKIPDFYRGLAPLRILENLGLKTTMTATSETGDPSDFPKRFEVDTSKFSLTIVDGSGSPTVSQSFTSDGNLIIVYKLQNCVTDPITTCTYTTDYSDPLLNLQIDGQTLRTFYNQIWTSGESPNDVIGNFSITFKGDKFPPSDTQVTYTLESSDGQLVF